MIILLAILMIILPISYGYYKWSVMNLYMDMFDFTQEDEMIEIYKKWGFINYQKPTLFQYWLASFNHNIELIKWALGLHTRKPLADINDIKSSTHSICQKHASFQEIAENAAGIKPKVERESFTNC